MYEDLLAFLKHPTYQEDANTQWTYRFRYLFRLTVVALAISVLIGLFTGILQMALELDLGQHALEDWLNEYSPLGLLFMAVVVAPVLEELFFRGPLVWFKNSRHFKGIFYGMALLFGYIHISNFELSTQVLALSPLLVAPQISMGLLLGTLRIKFGLLWSMAMHAIYNLVLIGPMVLLKLLNIPLE